MLQSPLLAASAAAQAAIVVNSVMAGGEAKRRSPVAEADIATCTDRSATDDGGGGDAGGDAGDDGEKKKNQPSFDRITTSRWVGKGSSGDNGFGNRSDASSTGSGTCNGLARVGGGMRVGTDEHNDYRDGLNVHDPPSRLERAGSHPSMVALERKIATLSKLVGSSPEGSEVGGEGFDAADEEEEGRKVIKGRGRAATREVEQGEQNYMNSGGWGEEGDGGEEENGDTCRRGQDGAVESCVGEKGNGQSMQQPKELCEDETTTTTTPPTAIRNDDKTEEGEGKGGEGDGVSARVSFSVGEEADGGKVGGNDSKKAKVLGEKSGKAGKKTGGKKTGGKPFVKPLHPQQQQRKERRKGHAGRRGELRSEDGETYVLLLTSNRKVAVSV